MSQLHSVERHLLSMSLFPSAARCWIYFGRASLVWHYICMCVYKYKYIHRLFFLIFTLLSWFLPCAQSVQLCPTLFDCLDCSPPGPSVHGVSQARTLEWVAMPSSRGSSPPRGWAWVSCVSCTAGVFFATEPPGKLNSANQPWLYIRPLPPYILNVFVYCHTKIKNILHGTVMSLNFPCVLAWQDLHCYPPSHNLRNAFSSMQIWLTDLLYHLEGKMIFLSFY